VVNLWWIFVILGLLVGLVLLDGMIGRSFLKSYLDSHFVEGGGDGRMLIVSCVGILADAVESTRAIAKDAWGVRADVLHIGYGGDIFVAKHITAQAAKTLRELQEDRKYKNIVLIGSSMGAFVGMDMLLELRRSGYSLPDVSVVLVDPPSGSKDMLPAGKFIVPVLQMLPFGPVCKFLLKGVMHKMLVPPKDEYIQSDLDKGEVKRSAMQMMQHFGVPIWRDELVFMHQHKAYLPENFAWLGSVLYIMCNKGNDTVAQPQAANTWAKWTGGKAVVRPLPVPHCSYAQLPEIWFNAFYRALWEG
jgi:pimeloyl-ACP methyl ester carboxylesterase